MIIVLEYIDKIQKEYNRGKSTEQICDQLETILNYDLDNYYTCIFSPVSTTSKKTNGLRMRYL